MESACVSIYISQINPLESSDYQFAWLTPFSSRKLGFIDQNFKNTPRSTKANVKFS